MPTEIQPEELRPNFRDMREALVLLNDSVDALSAAIDELASRISALEQSE